MGSSLRPGAGASPPHPEFQLALQLDQAGRHADALSALRRASAGRCAAAMAYLASRLLVGRAAPLAPGEAIPLMADAARLGSADANLFMANLTALGEGVAQSWPAAVRHLRRAAELGSSRAQAQLRFLAQAGPEASAWAALARSIDPAGWLSPPPAQAVRLASRPAVQAVAGLLAPGVCDWIIARARSQLRPATVVEHGSGRTALHHGRSNSAASFDLLSLDLVILLVQARLATLLGAPVSRFERTQVLHYAVGQQFGPHYDFLPTPRPPDDPGQRAYTALIYLNADFEGGATAFPTAGLEHRGGRGDALWFANVDATGAPDRASLHAGLPPTRGEKWVLSQWVRDRAPGLDGGDLPPRRPA